MLKKRLENGTGPTLVTLSWECAVQDHRDAVEGQLATLLSRRDGIRS